MHSNDLVMIVIEIHRSQSFKRVTFGMKMAISFFISQRDKFRLCVIKEKRIYSNARIIFSNLNTKKAKTEYVWDSNWDHREPQANWTDEQKEKFT